MIMEVIEINDATLSGEEIRERLRRDRDIAQIRLRIGVDSNIELCQALKVFDYVGAPKECRKAHEHINEVLSTIDREVLADFEQIIVALDQAHESDDYDSVSMAVDAAVFNRLHLLQRIVMAGKEAVIAMEQQAGALKPIADKLAAAAEKTVAKVRDELIAIGSGPEAMQGYASNRNAAEVQFDYLARRGNIRSRTDLDAARAALAEWQAAHSQVGRHREALQLAQRHLREAAAKSLGR
jgi:hypothetical protein